MEFEKKKENHGIIMEFLKSFLCGSILTTGGFKHYLVKMHLSTQSCLLKYTSIQYCCCCTVPCKHTIIIYESLDGV